MMSFQTEPDIPSLQMQAKQITFFLKYFSTFRIKSRRRKNIPVKNRKRDLMQNLNWPVQNNPIQQDDSVNKLDMQCTGNSSSWEHQDTF